MRIRVVSETASAEYLYKLMTEFRETIVPLGNLYLAFPFDVDIVFRCREEIHQFKTFSRFSKIKNILHIQISFSEEKILRMLKAEQRFSFGHITYSFLSEAILKITFDESAKKFLSKLQKKMHDKGWLEEEVDYSKSLDEDF